jgi:hypothetical protein
MPLFLETLVTVPVRSNTVRFGTVPRTVRSDIEMYDIVPCVFDGVQYGTPCIQDCVHVTVPFSFVQGIKNYKRNNTHFKHKYLKEKFSRIPLIVLRIIEIYMDVDPHLDHRAAPLIVN